MQYRYLDLRNEEFQQRLRIRAKIIGKMRRFLDKNNFLEIETPTLVRRTAGVSI
jgi:aspartyl-tRNA synthetase